MAPHPVFCVLSDCLIVCRSTGRERRCPAAGCRPDTSRRGRDLRKSRPGRCPRTSRRKGQVKGGDAEIEAAKPETAGDLRLSNAPDVTAAEAAGEPTVLPGMIEVKADIIAARVVPDPLAVAMDVRGFGMTFLVVEGRGAAVLRSSTWDTGGPCLGMYPPPTRVAAAVFAVLALGRAGKR